MNARQQVIVDYLAATIEGDLDRVGSFLTDDCRVWLPRSASKLGLPRPLEGRDAFLALVRAMLGSTEHWKPRAWTPLRFFFDDEAVAVHQRLEGDMPNGSVYDNDYVFLYSFDRDKICEIREYTDTAYIGDFLSENREG